LSIGERRHRVVFQSATIAQDALGEPVKTWANLCTSWSMVQPMKGAERLKANQVQADLTTRIVTRARSELSALAPDDRATWSGHTYDIKAVIHRDHRRHELEILCEEHL
jgi:SPP1 family predicted phage head-tail adaptor